MRVASVPYHVPATYNLQKITYSVGNATANAIVQLICMVDVLYAVYFEVLTISNSHIGKSNSDSSGGRRFSSLVTL